MQLRPKLDEIVERWRSDFAINLLKMIGLTYPMLCADLLKHAVLHLFATHDPLCEVRELDGVVVKLYQVMM